MKKRPGSPRPFLSLAKTIDLTTRSATDFAFDHQPARFGRSGSGGVRTTATGSGSGTASGSGSSNLFDGGRRRLSHDVLVGLGELAVILARIVRSGGRRGGRRFRQVDRRIVLDCPGGFDGGHWLVRCAPRDRRAVHAGAGARRVAVPRSSVSLAFRPNRLALASTVSVSAASSSRFILLVGSRTSRGRLSVDHPVAIAVAAPAPPPPAPPPTTFALLADLRPQLSSGRASASASSSSVSISSSTSGSSSGIAMASIWTPVIGASARGRRARRVRPHRWSFRSASRPPRRRSRRRSAFPAP